MLQYYIRAIRYNTQKGYLATMVWCLVIVSLPIVLELFDARYARHIAYGISCSASFLLSIEQRLRICALDRYVRREEGGSLSQHTCSLFRYRSDKPFGYAFGIGGVPERMRLWKSMLRESVGCAEAMEREVLFVTFVFSIGGMIIFSNPCPLFPSAKLTCVTIDWRTEE